MTVLQGPGQLSGFLFLCGTEDTVLSILGNSYPSLNQTKCTAIKDLSPYEWKHKYQLSFWSGSNDDSDEND